METIRYYTDIILSERSWSWAIIGILYVLFALFVRSLMMRPLVSRYKQLPRELQHPIRSKYLKLSLFGWFFLALPPLGFAFFWIRKELLPISGTDLLLAALCALSFFVGIFCHSQAFGIAGILTLKQNYEKEHLLA
jgi:hypothetical protein